MAAIVLFVLTGALAAIIFLAAWETGSAGVLADGVHSAALAAFSLTALVGLRRLSGGLAVVSSVGFFVTAVFIARLSAERLSSPPPVETPFWAVSLLVIAVAFDLAIRARGGRSRSGAVEFCARLRMNSALGGLVALGGMLAGGAFDGAGGLFVSVVILRSCWKAAARGWKDFLTRRAKDAEAELFSRARPAGLLFARRVGLGRAAVWKVIYDGDGSPEDAEALIREEVGLDASVEFARAAEDPALLALAERHAKRTCARDPRVGRLRGVRLAGSEIVLEVELGRGAGFPAVARDIEEKLSFRLARPVWVVRAGHSTL